MTKYTTGDRPARQGFYRVLVGRAREGIIAEWREYDRKEGKRWWQYTSELPTAEKTRQPLEGVVGYAKCEQADVDQAMRRQLTVEEKIESSLRGYEKSRDWLEPVQREIPPSRQLQVGQSVLVGHLDHAEVVALHDNGQLVTIKHRSLRDEEKQGTAAVWHYRTWHWLDVLPAVSEPKSGYAVTPKFSSQSTFTSPVDNLIHRMYRDGVVDNPECQREYVWTLEDKNRYLDALFKGRPLGLFVFIKERPPQPDVLFDGKQRMSTLMDLVSSTLPYKGVYWHEMSHADRNTVMKRSAQFAELDAKQYSKADLLDIFLEINAAGVPQTEEHLAKVRAMRDAEREKEASQT